MTTIWNHDVPIIDGAICVICGARIWEPYYETHESWHKQIEEWGTEVSLPKARLER